MSRKAKSWTGRVENGVLLLFLIWAAVGVASMALRVDAGWIEARGLPAWMEAFAKVCLSWGDFVFILLAFLNVYLAAARRLGLNKARTGAVAIMAISAVVETVGTKTGYPFGAYLYTDNFGPWIPGALPMAIPLAWYIVVAGAYLVVSQWWYRATRWEAALVVALFAVGFDWVLEPFAWHVRGYWQWAAESVPLQNYASWFVLSLLFARYVPLYAPPAVRVDWRPVWALGLMLLLFIVGRVAVGV